MAAPFDRCTAYFGAPFHTHTLGCGQTIVVRLAGTLEAGPGIPRSEYMRRRLMSESNRVGPNHATVSSDVCFAPKADNQADISVPAARFSPLAHRGARVVGTDALRVLLISQAPSDGEERNQGDDDNPNIDGIRAGFCRRFVLADPQRDKESLGYAGASRRCL